MGCKHTGIDLEPRMVASMQRLEVYQYFAGIGEAASGCAAQEVVVTAIGSPIPHTLYPFLAVLLLIVGLVLTAAFFIYEATTSKFSRSLSREFATGGVASLFLGFGTLFLLLWTGVYV
ncbi:unnamed protein product [Sphagnum tenellum]